MMKVSVIIPVYNAAKYVTQAVESALAQPETTEVLLIEDGSPDNSLEVCQQLAEKYEKVKLLRHSNGENLGAGASRNLGMKNASCEYIAFLDADDYYLPGRFAIARELFTNHADCEGVYEAAGMYTEDIEGSKRWISAKKSDTQIQTMSKKVDPEELGRALITGAHGYFLLDSLVIKKEVIDKSGLMNEELRLHQDTEFIIRVSIVSRLFPGNLEVPVCMWRVHPQNRITAPRSQSEEYRNRMAYWMTLYHWSIEKSDNETQKLILNGIINYTKSHKYYKKFPRQYFPTRLIWLTRYFRLIKYPQVIQYILSKK